MKDTDFKKLIDTRINTLETLYESYLDSVAGIIDDRCVVRDLQRKLSEKMIILNRIEIKLEEYKDLKEKLNGL